MALLKNLQEKYASNDPFPATELEFGELKGVKHTDGDEARGDPSPGTEAAVSVQPEDSVRAVKMRKSPRRRKARQSPVGKPPVEAEEIGLPVTGLTRFLRRLPGFTRSTDQQATPETSITDLHRLQEKNRRLAERLEQLEDKSWEVRESEEIHRSLSEAFGDIVLHRDSCGELIFHNSVFNTYFNDALQLPTPLTPIRDGILSDLPGDPDDVQDRLAAQSRDVELETLIGPRWFSWTDLPVRDPHTGEVGLRSVARDITEQKNSQQEILTALTRAEQANAAKSRFLAMVSHEIRTPLNGILGMAGLLGDGTLAADQKTYVEAISSSGGTLLHLIEDLLDTARIESGHVELALRPTNLVHLVEDVAELIAPVAEEKGLELATFVDPSIPASIHVDSGRLRQILLNLVGNAVKFTKRGGLGIEVELEKTSVLPDKIQLRFSVRDSGPGLDKGDQNRIFEEFVQTDEGATRAHGGAGLGLAISKNLVELMGGSIDVTSRLGRGTVFSFEIATRQSGAQFGEPKVEPDVCADIALIWTKSPARRAFVRAMRAMGAQVSTFDSPPAFELHQQNSSPYDVVISTFTQWGEGELNSQRSLSSRLVNIGGYSINGRTPELEKTGLDAWLTQPVRQQSLYRVLTNQITPDDETTVDSSAPQSTSRVQPLKVLLAEDNPINALLVKSLLGKAGHSVTHVEDGEQAVRQVELQVFDVVLMDLHMPVTDGLAALREIRALGPGKSAMPIIVLSADGQEGVKDKALALGAQDFLLKPIDPDALTRVLERQVSSLSAA